MKTPDFIAGAIVNAVQHAVVGADEDLDIIVVSIRQTIHTGAVIHDGRLGMDDIPELTFADSVD